jgi:outer membrane protein TolC
MAALLTAADAPPLTRDPELSFGRLLAAALPRAPEFVAGEARRDEARRHDEAAGAWLAGPPALEVNYLDDRTAAARGAQELEYGVQLPLWRPGERRTASRLGAELGRQSAAWQTYLELTVAGRLRACLADLAGAERLLALEREATAEARQLVATVERMAAAGESARAEVAQAQALLLQQRREELAAANALAKAEAAYVELTGLRTQPAAPHREEAAGSATVPDQHPWLRYLASGVEVARHSADQVGQEERGRPAVLIGGRRQREGTGAPREDAMALGLSLPFGGARRTAARLSSARREQAEATSALLAAQRELAQRLRELRLDAAHVAASLGLSAEQLELDRRQVAAARTAFEAGEFNLFHVLTALRQARASTRDHELLLRQREHLAAQINQTLGNLP